jgi:putative PIN family toxin of toxin-antitoxin system
MNVVLDANIYVSALITAGGNPAQILTRWQEGEIDVVVSDEIIEEIRRVTSYPKLWERYRSVRENRDELIERLREIAIVVEPSRTLSAVLQDESDNRYVECAIEGRAEYIVTGDPHLLDIREYQGVEILSPAALLAVLAATRR